MHQQHETDRARAAQLSLPDQRISHGVRQRNLLFRNTYYAKECWSIHAAILPQLEQTALYNSINFNWDVDYAGNLTVLNTQVIAFLCPSDPNGTQYGNNNTTGNNCYFGCVGTTTNILNGNPTTVPNLSAVPTTGLFAFQQSKSIAAVTDGTSNTIAFAESTVGSTTELPGQKLIGLVNVAIPAAAIQTNAFNNPAGRIIRHRGLHYGVEYRSIDRPAARRQLGPGGDVCDPFQHHRHP